MKKVLQKIAQLILFTTPLGYVLGLFHILNNNYISGVYIQVSYESPLDVFVKNSPLPSERFRWITYGVTLLVQGFTILLLKADFHLEIESLVVGYILLSLVYGFVNLVSGIFPQFPWNERPFKFSVFEIILFASIIVTFIIASLKP